MKDLELLEDKVTKFGGKVYPDFGWCCFLAGGAGSGKGYNFDKYVPIQGYKFDPDHVKEYTVKKMRVVSNDEGNYLVYKTPSNEEWIDLDERGIKPPYNTTNAKFTGLVHELSRPLTKRLKNFIFKDKGGSKDRLPNIIFDCTMSEIKDYQTMIPTMKSLGYKVALVCVFTDIDVAITQNKERGSKSTIDDEGNVKHGRRVDYKTLLDTHAGFLETLSEISSVDPHVVSQIDDAWAIVSARNEQPDVFSIKNGGTLDLGKVKNFIINDLSKIHDRQTKYNLSLNKDSYNEGELITGAYDLYEALKELKRL